jgi:ribokinase
VTVEMGEPTRAIRSPEVVVVGSINEDYVVRVSRRPTAGETVGDAIFVRSDGGKGATQAVAAASQGASVALVARVGDDAAGEDLMQGLVGANVETSWVRRSPGTMSGAAFLTVTPDGENAVVVAPGANALLDVGDIDWASDAIRGAQVIVLQLETGIDAVVAAVAMASQSTTVVLNAAPARTVPDTTLHRVDVLVVNKHEAAALLGGGERDSRSTSEALLARGQLRWSSPLGKREPSSRQSPGSTGRYRTPKAWLSTPSERVTRSSGSSQRSLRPVRRGTLTGRYFSVLLRLQ